MAKLNWAWRNILGGAGFVVGIILLSAIMLNLITRHNRYTTVPDFNNMTLSEAVWAAEGAGVKVDVLDSVYVPRWKRGAVYTQFPKPGATVKKGRTIDLTIASQNTKKVTMPSLVGMSLRQAKAEILSRGLMVGKLVYKADIATDYVLGQLCNGSTVSSGSQIAAGSTIDLILGLNYADDRGVLVPDVKGLSMQRALDVLKENSLNVRLKFDRGVHNYSDSLNSVVYLQNPGPSQIPVNRGSTVNISLRLGE